MNLYRLKKILPTALTFVGVAGVFITGYLAHRGTKNAIEDLENIPEEEKPKNFKEEFKATWKHYIPAFASATLSSTAIIASHRLSAKQIALLSATASYVTSNKDKIEREATKLIGEEKMNEIKKKIKPVYPSKGVSIEDTGRGKQLCFDGYSGRWFYSSVEDVDKALHKWMEEIGEFGSGCLNDLYRKLGIEETHFGWQWGYVITEGYYEEAPVWVANMIDYEELGKKVYCIEPETNTPGWNYPMEGWMEI